MSPLRQRLVHHRRVPTGEAHSHRRPPRPYRRPAGWSAWWVKFDERTGRAAGVQHPVSTERRAFRLAAGVATLSGDDADTC